MPTQGSAVVQTRTLTSMLPPKKFFLVPALLSKAICWAMARQVSAVWPGTWDAICMNKARSH